MGLVILRVSLLLFVASSSVNCYEDVGWNSDNIPTKLKAWIKDVEFHPYQIQISEDKEALEWACYTEKDVSAAFIISPKVQEKQFSELDGQIQGRIIFNDKKTFLESNQFNQGMAQGSGKITLRNDRKNLNQDFDWTGSFYNGCFEGRVRGYNYLPLYDEEDRPIPSNETVMTYIAAHVRGQPLGPIWRPVISQDGVRTGYFYGPNSKSFNDVKDPQNFGGSDLVYIYPDLKTAFRGSFDVKGRMINAKQVEIVGEKDQEFGGIKELKFSEPFGKASKSDLSTSEHLSSEPLLRDPYESQMVSVKASSVTKAGEGVFVSKDVPRGTVVSYFNGVRLNKNDVYSWNPFRKNSVYLVELADDKGQDMFLDIPAKFTDWKRYQASTGHKVNHGKDPNSAYTECQHPRFGNILCLYTLKDLSAGKELFTRYDVSMDKDGMKKAMKLALGVGQWYTGKPKEEFVSEVKPIIQMAAKMAEQFDMNYFLGF